jgi:hypothetical protein
VRVAGGPGLAGRVEEGWASRRYGLKQPAPVLSFTQVSDRSVAFCSLVGPASGPRFEGLTTTGGPAEGQIRCVVRGSTGESSWVDEALIATGSAPAAADEPDLGFLGRHLALRRDGAGRIIYLCAHGVEHLACAGAPGLVSNQENVEWSL